MSMNEQIKKKKLTRMLIEWSHCVATDLYFIGQGINKFGPFFVSWMI